MALITTSGGGGAELTSVRMWRQYEVECILESCFAHMQPLGSSKALPNQDLAHAHEWLEDIMQSIVPAAAATLGDQSLKWRPIPSADPYSVTAGLTNGRQIPLVLVVRPPHVLNHPVWQQLQEIGPAFHADGFDKSHEWNPATRILAQIHDVCLQSKSPFFVLTSYEAWCFGVFDHDWTSCLHTGPVSSPMAPRVLAAWAHSATGGRGGLEPCRYVEFAILQHKRQLEAKHHAECERLNYNHVRERNIVLRKGEQQTQRDERQRLEKERLEQRHSAELQQLQAQLDMHQAQRLREKLQFNRATMPLPPSPSSTAPTYVSEEGTPIAGSSGAFEDMLSTDDSESLHTPDCFDDDSLYVTSPPAGDSHMSSSGLSANNWMYDATSSSAQAQSAPFNTMDAGHTPASAGNAREVDGILHAPLSSNSLSGWNSGSGSESNLSAVVHYDAPSSDMTPPASAQQLLNHTLSGQVERSPARESLLHSSTSNIGSSTPSPFTSSPVLDLVAKQTDQSDSFFGLTEANTPVEPISVSDWMTKANCQAPPHVPSPTASMIMSQSPPVLMSPPRRAAIVQDYGVSQPRLIGIEQQLMLGGPPRAFY